MGIPWRQAVKQVHTAITKVPAGDLLRKSFGLSICRSGLPQRRSIYITKMSRQCCTKPSPTIPTITGNFQSPINIIPGDAVKDDKLSNNPLSYSEEASSFTLTNTGFTLNAEPVHGKEYMISGGPLANPYSLVGFHFHWVKDNVDWSEHTVNDAAYSAELHLVHLNKQKYKSVEEALSYPDGLCVLGVFLKSADQHSDNKELEMLTRHFGDLKYKCASVAMKEPFCPYGLLPEDRMSYWTYPGSLTTPPYSECVTWVVFKDAIDVSPAQMLAFRSLRPVTTDEATKHEKNNTPMPETTTNCRDTYPVAARVIKSTFDN
eukprot:gene3557-4061_t